MVGQVIFEASPKACGNSRAVVQDTAVGVNGHRHFVGETTIEAVPHDRRWAGHLGHGPEMGQADEQIPRGEARFECSETLRIGKRLCHG